MKLLTYVLLFTYVAAGHAQGISDFITSKDIYDVMLRFTERSRIVDHTHTPSQLRNLLHESIDHTVARKIAGSPYGFFNLAFFGIEDLKNQRVKGEGWKKLVNNAPFQTKKVYNYVKKDLITKMITVDPVKDKKYITMIKNNLIESGLDLEFENYVKQLHKRVLNSSLDSIKRQVVGELGIVKMDQKAFNATAIRAGDVIIQVPEGTSEGRKVELKNQELEIIKNSDRAHRRVFVLTEKESVSNLKKAEKLVQTGRRQAGNFWKRVLLAAVK